MHRLKIMGGYCPKGMQVSDASNLGTRGANIFLPDETQTADAALYLSQLLFYLKSWAQQLPKDPANNGQESIFVKSYNELRANGVSFPSEAQASRASSASMINSRQREARGGSNPREDRSRNSAAAAGGGINKSATQANLNSVLGAAMGRDAAAAASQQQPAGSGQKKSSGFAQNLKKEMQFVRDESKKSQKYLQLLEQQGFVVDSMEQHTIVVSTIQQAQQKAEQCIETLMSDQGSSKISNTEELMQKILGFQD